MIVTSNPDIAERSKLLRNYGQDESGLSMIIGQNSRLDELHAAVLRIQLKKLDEWNDLRRSIAKHYREAFADLPVNFQAETGKGNYHLFVVTTPRRDRLRLHLRSLNIPTLVHYPIPLHRQHAFAEFDPDPCPNAERLCSQALSLPMHPFLSVTDQEQVIDGVRSFFRE